MAKKIEIEATATQAELNEALAALAADYVQLMREGAISKDSAPDTERIKAALKRNQRGFISKTQTKLWQLEEIFLNDQKGKGSAAATIKYYERTFKKLYLFFSFILPKDTKEYNKLLAQLDDNANAEVEFGSIQPLAVLEMDNLPQEFRDYLTDTEELTPPTVQSYMRGFRVIMYYAMENGWIESYKIQLKEVSAPIKQVYTDKEIKRLLVKPDTADFSQYRNWVIVNWFLATGNRVSSVCDIKVKDIDLEEGYANINRQKNKEPIQIPIVSKMRNILREFIGLYRTDEDGKPLDNQYLFCNQYGERLTEQGLKMAIAKYNKSRGVNKTSCHLFRHTFAKQWIMNGGDTFTLQRMLGHKSLKMVAHYSNLYKSDTKKKAEEHSALALTKSSGGKRLKQRKIN